MAARAPRSGSFVFQVELALPLGKGTVLCGWAEDRQQPLSALTLFFDDGSDLQFRSSSDDVSLLRGPRQEGSSRQDFLLWVLWQPAPHQAPMFTLNHQVAYLEPLPKPGLTELLASTPLLGRFGQLLRTLAQDHQDHVLLHKLEPKLSPRDESRAAISKQWAAATDSCRHKDLFAAAITRSFALDEAGLLIFGVLVLPPHTPVQIWLHRPEQEPLDVTPQLFRLPAGKLASDMLKEKFPDAAGSLMFMLHAPCPTPSNAPRALRLCLPGLPDFWLKLDTTPSPLSGAALARQMLKPLVPAHEYRGRMLELLDSGLGEAIAWATRVNGSDEAAERIVEFGTPPEKPTCTVIVPLYGRCDFMRHQLAQFCDDPEFAKVDLLYVVDDPTLLQDALDTAGKFQPLFKVPLRVLSYGENRGFARANNSAVRHARSPLLLLMNSDVLPQAPGWLGVLRRALSTLKGAVMVGPLLQFADGSVQHGGMAPMRQFAYPGFVFSHHPGKGVAWSGGDTPVAAPMLTGACLLLKKADYLAVGGFDEGYVVGDFEDSHFSLALRARGGKLFVVPAARLWHLERKSQYLGDNQVDERDLLTLYNAWRYRNHIRSGALPDPETLVEA